MRRTEARLVQGRHRLQQTTDNAKAGGGIKAVFFTGEMGVRRLDTACGVEAAVVVIFMRETHALMCHIMVVP